MSTPISSAARFARTEPDLADLTAGDFKSVLVRAAKRTMADNMTSVAKGVAYGTFFAIPSALIVALGVLNLTAGPGSINKLVDKLNGVVPASAQDLIRSNLQQVSSSQGGRVMVIVGLVLAVASLMGAVQTAMWGLNIAYERREQRNFFRQRVSALADHTDPDRGAGRGVRGARAGSVHDGMGRPAQAATRARCRGCGGRCSGRSCSRLLLAAFGAILYLGPDVDHPRLQFITPGAVTAALLWIVGSALFGVYASRFSSYNKAWGSLSAVIVTLTWLWLCSVAILFAAEINAEVERTREILAGARPSDTLTAQHK